MVSQTTPAARAAIEGAEKVLFMAADLLSHAWLRELNATAESLHDAYAPGKQRRDTYVEMVARIMHEVRSGLSVCIAAYGHPGVFAYPLHEAVRQARAEGFAARMLPAVSAVDCLYADLGVDPGHLGCATFEATDFLLFNRRFDPACALILWQIGLVGVLDFKPVSTIWSAEGLAVLADVLQATYGAEHACVVYEAAPYGFCNPRVDRVTIGTLTDTPVSPISTLYIPPLYAAQPDEPMASRLHITL